MVLIGTGHFFVMQMRKNPHLILSGIFGEKVLGIRGFPANRMIFLVKDWFAWTGLYGILLLRIRHEGSETDVTCYCSSSMQGLRVNLCGVNGNSPEGFAVYLEKI